MDSKHRFLKGILVGVLVTVFAGLLIIGIAAGILMFGSRAFTEKELAQGVGTQLVETEERTLNMEALEKKMQIIQYLIDQYFLFDEDLEKVQDGIFTGMMYGLDDPYSVYYTAEEYQRLREETDGRYEGIGAMVSQDQSTGIISIIKVFKNSPAREAGLLPGDILYKIENDEVTGENLDLLVRERIRGEEGTSVSMTVLRGESKEEVELVIDRRTVNVDTVEYQMLENNIGYISVLQFDGVTANQFAMAIDELEERGMEKLVVDLRNNPGGVLDSAVQMMAYVLPEGMLIYTEDKNGRGDQYLSYDQTLYCIRDVENPKEMPENPSKHKNAVELRAEVEDENGNIKARKIVDDHELGIPMAVLVNANSASASEVFAGAMKDYEKAKIVGTTTFGKGIVQQVIPIEVDGRLDGSAIKITISHYFTPNGNDVHEKGVTPDVEVELEEELKKQVEIDLEQDNQLQAAIAAME